MSKDNSYYYLITVIGNSSTSTYKFNSLESAKNEFRRLTNKEPHTNKIEKWYYQITNIIVESKIKK